jgi:hypothetical protein
MFETLGIWSAFVVPPAPRRRHKASATHWGHDIVLLQSVI